MQRDRGFHLAAAFVAVVGILVAFGPLIAPFSATEFSPSTALFPPQFPHVFGTDEFGRDVFSRILSGAPYTLLPALAAAALGVSVGTVTGLLAGYLGGRADEIIMRFMDVLLSFPALILAMLIVVMLGGNVVNVVLAIGIVFWPRSARLVRSAAMEIALSEFIDAARARGESMPYILFRELLPNLWAFIIVDFALRCSYGILLTASLSYLGIGVHPPTPAWGLMVKEAQQYIQFAPWLVLFPCLAIALVSIGSVLFGEYIRKKLATPTRLARA